MMMDALAACDWLDLAESASELSVNWGRFTSLGSDASVVGSTMTVTSAEEVEEPQQNYPTGLTSLDSHGQTLTSESGYPRHSQYLGTIGVVQGQGHQQQCPVAPVVHVTPGGGFAPGRNVVDRDRARTGVSVSNGTVCINNGNLNPIFRSDLNQASPRAVPGVRTAPYYFPPKLVHVVHNARTFNSSEFQAIAPKGKMCMINVNVSGNSSEKTASIGLLFNAEQAQMNIAKRIARTPANEGDSLVRPSSEQFRNPDPHNISEANFKPRLPTGTNFMTEAIMLVGTSIVDPKRIPVRTGIGLQSGLSKDIVVGDNSSLGQKSATATEASQTITLNCQLDVEQETNLEPDFETACKQFEEVGLSYLNSKGFECLQAQASEFLQIYQGLPDPRNKECGPVSPSMAILLKELRDINAWQLKPGLKIRLYVQVLENLRGVVEIVFKIFVQIRPAGLLRIFATCDYPAEPPVVDFGYCNQKSAQLGESVNKQLRLAMHTMPQTYLIKDIVKRWAKIVQQKLVIMISAAEQRRK